MSISNSSGLPPCLHKPERVAIFLDVHNLFSLGRGCSGSVNLLRLRNYLGEERQILETFLYVGTRPTHIEVDQNFHRQLRLQNFLVRTKLARIRDDGSFKCDFDAEMAVDVVEFVRKTHPDVVVLGTGDGDFSFIAHRLRLRGVWVEVAATRQAVSGELLEAANDFIDIGRAVSYIPHELVTVSDKKLKR